MWIHKLTFHSHPPNIFSVSAFKFLLLLSCFGCLQVVKLPGGARSHILLFRLNSFIHLECEDNPVPQHTPASPDPKLCAKMMSWIPFLQLRAGRAASWVREGMPWEMGLLGFTSPFWGCLGRESKGKMKQGSNAPLVYRLCWFRHHSHHLLPKRIHTLLTKWLFQKPLLLHIST